MKYASRILSTLLALLVPLTVLPDEHGFEFFALHLMAAGQPTAIGKELEAAYTYQGKVYWGYGDYDANTGPIAIVALNPQNNTFSMEYTADTEAIHTYRVLSNGKLYVPYIDPRSYNPEYSRKDPDRWIAADPIDTSVHVFDIIDFDGKVYLCGSGDPEAFVWVAPISETPFTTSLSVDPRNETFSRFYFIGQLNRKLYVQAIDRGLQKHPYSKVFDGATWKDGPDLLPEGGTGYRAITFASKMVYLQWRRPSIVGGGIYAFNGATASIVTPFTDVAGYTTYGKELFVARRNGSITKTTDLLNWSTVSTFGFPAQPRSIAIADGRIFIGLANAEIYRSRFSLPPPAPTTQ